MIEVLDRARPVIQLFETCSLKVKLEVGFMVKAYLCPAHIWTIGWGETGPDIHEGLIWTQETADTTLELRMKQYLHAVIMLCPKLLCLPPNKAAACLSLAYNIGLGAFGASSVCRLTRRNEFKRAADCFLMWNKGGGRVLRGLTRRRAAERLLYLEK